MIYHLIIASLLCVGIYVSLSPGMILGKIGDQLSRLPHWIANPLGDCITCMASVYGASYWMLFFGIPKTIIAFSGLLLFIIALSGLNFIINTLVINRA